MARSRWSANFWSSASMSTGIYNLHRRAKVFERTPRVLSNGCDGNVHGLGHFAERNCEAVHEDDSGSLLRGQCIERRSQHGVGQVVSDGRTDEHGIRRIDRMLPRRPTMPALRCGLTDPIQVANGIRHLAEAFPIDPCPHERFERRLTTDDRPVPGAERLTQPGFSIDHELVEAGVVRRSTSTGRGHHQVKPRAGWPCATRRSRCFRHDLPGGRVALSSRRAPVTYRCSRG